MTFDNPSAVWFALVAVPVLILYFLRLAVHREKVGTGMFWRRVLPKTNPLRRRVASLAAQLLLIALMVAGLAQLYLDPQFGSRKFLVVIDNSPSMAAVSDGKTRLSLAVEATRKLIEQLRIGDEMAIFVESPVVCPLCRMTGSRKQLHESLADVFLASHRGNGLEAISGSERYQNERLIVIGDGCTETTATLPAFNPDVPLAKYLTVGKSENNVALTHLAARHSLFAANAIEVMIEVESFADEQFEVMLRVTLGGAELAQEAVRLPPNSVWRKTFRIEGTAGGQLTARLDVVDALAADNTISIELPPPRSVAVKLHGPESESLARALAAIPQLRIVQDDRESNVSIYDGQVVAEQLDRPTLIINPSGGGPSGGGPSGGGPSGGGPSGGGVDWKAGDYQYDITVAQDDSSPLVRGIALNEAVFERVRTLVPQGDFRVAATGQTGSAQSFPLLFSYASNPRRVVLAVDPAQTDLIDRGELPKLLANCLAWLVPPPAEFCTGMSPIDEHEIRPATRLSKRSSELNNANLLDYPWWYWPCWYLAIVLVVGLLPLEWWLYQRRIIA